MDFVEEVFNYYADDSAEMEIGLMREVFEKVIKSICVDFVSFEMIVLIFHTFMK